jgi:hypothetical protein
MVVHDEERCDPGVLRQRRGQSRVVVDAQIPAEPDDARRHRRPADDRGKLEVDLDAWWS